MTETPDGAGGDVGGVRMSVTGRAHRLAMFSRAAFVLAGDLACPPLRPRATACAFFLRAMGIGSRAPHDLRLRGWGLA